MAVRLQVPPGIASVSHRGVEYEVDAENTITIKQPDGDPLAELAPLGVTLYTPPPKAPPPPPSAEDLERADLLARAEKVGVTPDGRWKIDRLKKEVEAAEAAAEKKRSAEGEQGAPKSDEIVASGADTAKSGE